MTTDPAAVWPDGYPVLKSDVRALIAGLQALIAETQALISDGDQAELIVRDAGGFVALTVSGAALAHAFGALTAGAEGVFRVIDQDGFVAASIGADEVAGAFGGLSAGEDGALRFRDALGFISHIWRAGNMLPRDDVRMTHDLATGHAFRVLDDQGFVAFAVSLDGETRANLVSAEAESEQLAARDAANLASSAAVARAINPNLQRPTAKYNHVVSYGQSLSTGFEGWPALSKTALWGSLMLGNATRPSARHDPEFAPLGVSTLQPLQAVVQSADGSSVLSDAAVAALSPGAGNEGESFDVAAVNTFRRLFLDHYGLASDASRLMVLTTAGAGGRTLEQLSKGADPELYHRAVDAATRVKAIATGESATYAVAAILVAQGEYNYNDPNGTNPDGTKAGYKALLAQLRSDLIADIATGIAGQDFPPAFLSYQTSGNWTRDDDDLGVGMAQLEFCNETPNCHLFAPAYPFTDKAGHLSANGYRWMGVQAGKVMHRVITLGQDWRPLHPLRATVSGSEILLDFHVPEPPLVFDLPYVVMTATDYANKGFRILVDGIEAAIADVSLVGQTMVRITLAAPPVGAVKVQYASKTTFNGNGCLRDSDPTVSPFVYEYDAGSGQYAEADIAALVGKPYPLHNWCCAFSLTASQE